MRDPIIKTNPSLTEHKGYDQDVQRRSPLQISRCTTLSFRLAFLLGPGSERHRTSAVCSHGELTYCFIVNATAAASWRRRWHNCTLGENNKHAPSHGPRNSVLKSTMGIWPANPETATATVATPPCKGRFHIYTSALGEIK
jgi:hypothetical protein